MFACKIKAYVISCTLQLQFKAIGCTFAVEKDSRPFFFVLYGIKQL